MMTSMLLMITRAMKDTRKIEAKIYDDEYALQGTTQWYSAFIIAHCQETGVSAKPIFLVIFLSFIFIYRLLANIITTNIISLALPCP